MYNSDIPTRAELPTTRQLLRSTVIAAFVAAVLLVTAILPAEYGIDPTGIGSVTGLTEMGEIKTQLEEEAEADRLKNVPATTGPQSRSGLFDRILALRLISPAEAQSAAKTDKRSFTLKPGQGAEIKLAMKKGAKVSYNWAVEGGTANYDLHGGTPGGKEKSFKRGRSVKGDEGVFEAPFDGNHGWFWRNRTKKNVTVTLTVSGDYAKIKRVM
tara:strand:- start:12991 stop:13629 length:639 start_codon:yes stop_codon:yes gene_type:complete